MLRRICFIALINFKVTFTLLTIRGLNDQAEFLGHVVTLTCPLYHGEQAIDTSRTSEPFEIQWSFQGVGKLSSVVIATLSSHGNDTTNVTSSNTTKYSIIDENNLIVSDVQFTDAGQYNCTLLSSRKTLLAQVYVLDTPRCHNLKTNLSLNERASFDCEVTYNGNQPPRLSWKHDKQNLTNSYQSEADPALPNKTEIVTTYFTALREYDGYVYGCHVSYPNTDFHYLCQAKKKLNIFFPVQKPSIKVVPYYNGTNKMFQSGTNILLLCMAKGHPHPKYRWEFLPLSKNSSRKMTLSTIAHYKINNAHTNSMGNYTCIASNEVNNTMYYQDKTVFIQIAEDKQSNSKADPHSPLPNPQFRVSDSKKGRSAQLYPKQEVGDIYMSPYAVGALASAGLAIVLVVVFIMLAIKFRAREKRLREKFSRTYDEMMDDQEQELLDDNIQPTGVDETQGQYGRMRQYWEIPRKDVRLMDVLATGSYCEVWRAKMKKNSDNKDIVKVAVKKVLDDASEQGRKFFLAEMEVLKMLKTHPSVIKLIGCYTLNEPWMLMVEYAKEGTLQKYLQKHRPGEQEVEINKVNVNEQSVHMKTTNNKVDAHRLLVLAAQVVSGLQHLQKFKLIYYRLSASNVLVSKCGVCKLSGFGFPQDVTERNLYEKDSYPIRWMAPESLKDKVFTVKSDVWAYGILVWEILHFGLKPYQDIENNETVQEEVLAGYRLPQPTHCSTELYTQLVQCWKEIPDDRPNYEGILQVLRQLDLNNTSHIILEDLPVLPPAENELATESV